MDSSVKALLIGDACMSFARTGDVALEASIPLESEEEVRVEESLKEGGSRSTAEEQNMSSC